MTLYSVNVGLPFDIDITRHLVSSTCSSCVLSVGLWSVWLPYDKLITRHGSPDSRPRNAFVQTAKLVLRLSQKSKNRCETYKRTPAYIQISRTKTLKVVNRLLYNSQFVSFSVRLVLLSSLFLHAVFIYLYCVICEINYVYKYAFLSCWIRCSPPGS